MKKVGTIALASAACVVAGAAAWADNTYYALSSPRIIVVPQLGVDDVDVEARPAPRPPRDTASAPQTKKVASREPARRKPFSVLPPPPPPDRAGPKRGLVGEQPEPEPTGPKRALLSAPPPPVPSIHDGPTPIKPTPRFGQPLPEAPPPLTTFTPPATPKPVASATPAPEAVAPLPASPVDDSDDHLPPPGDPRLAPPEPAQ